MKGYCALMIGTIMIAYRCINRKVIVYGKHCHSVSGVVRLR